MRKVWIVAADSGRAKFLAAENIKTLKEVHCLEHIESHFSDEELISDRPGRTNSRFGQSTHALPGRTNQQTKERHHFALEIAHFLEEAYRKSEFERLYLIVDLPFLGFLRQALPDQIKNLVHMEIQKDLTLLKPEEIRPYLPDIL